MAKNQLPDLEGSVAYQIYERPFDGNTAVQPIPAALPEEKVSSKKQKAPKAKLEIAPLAAIGLAVVVFLLAMVLYSYVQLYEATNQAGDLRAELTAAQNETAKLRSAYESRIKDRKSVV